MRRLVAVVTVVVLLAGLMLAMVACGGTDVAGTYKAEGDDPEFQSAELVINDDETFKVSVTIPGSDEEVSFTGTYTLDGDKITLSAEGMNETEAGTVEDGKLVFDEVTWVKE